MRLRERERYDTLYEVRDLVQSLNWVVLDVETTSLEGEIIQWAVAAPDGTILGQGFVQPTKPITEGARAVHSIQDGQVADAPPLRRCGRRSGRCLPGEPLSPITPALRRRASSPRPGRISASCEASQS